MCVYEFKFRVYVFKCSCAGFDRTSCEFSMCFHQPYKHWPRVVYPFLLELFLLLQNAEKEKGAQFYRGCGERQVGQPHHDRTAVRLTD
jgi:hypothetical protein